MAGKDVRHLHLLWRLAEKYMGGGFTSMMRSFGPKSSLVLLIQSAVLLCICLQAAAQSVSSQPANAAQSSLDFTRERQLVQQGKYDEAIAGLQQLASEHPD